MQAKMKHKKYEINFVAWIYNTAINYLDRQGLEIRCIKVEISPDEKNYNLTFTYQCKDTVESFDKMDLEFAGKKEPIVKYLCNRANHILVFGEKKNEL